MRAANQSGGKDNITVVLFRLEDDGTGPAGDPPTAEETIHQGLDRRRRPGGCRGRGSRARQAARRVRRHGAAPSRAASATGRSRATAPGRAARPRPQRSCREQARTGGVRPCRAIGFRPQPRVARPARARRGRGARRGRRARRRRLCRGPPGLLPRHRRQRPRHRVPRAARMTCRSASTSTRSSTAAACRRARSRPRAATACSTTSGAARPTRRIWCASSRAARSIPGGRPSERAHARAVRPDPGLAARLRRVRGRAGRAVAAGERPDGDLRRGLPRPLRLRPPVHPRAAARRRSLPLPARRAAGGVRAGDDLPDRRRPGARAGAVVRDRADPLLRDDLPAARPPRARALPLHDRGDRDRCC